MYVLISVKFKFLSSFLIAQLSRTYIVISYWNGNLAEYSHTLQKNTVRDGNW